MLKVAVVDANDRAAAACRNLCLSVVGQWLLWEMERAGVPNSPAGSADIVFLVHAGALDWSSKCRSALRRFRIPYECERRAGAPYVIAGGAVATTPFTATRIADAVVVGEGCRSVRKILSIVAGGGTVQDVREMLVASPHALERSQIAGVGRDPSRPWLLDRDPGQLAEPDEWIDWPVPPVKSDGHVVRVLGANGCARKRLFCSTSWSQRFKHNPSGEHVVSLLSRLAAAGERVQLLSNDPSQIPYYRLVKVRLDSESNTVQEGLDATTRRAIIEHRPRLARFCAEWGSERIRLSWGKPVPSDGLVDMLADLHAHKVHTHLFFIAGAPFEQDSDMSELVRLWERLAKAITWGVCRMKFTTFNSIPPAPLCRFLPGRSYDEHYSWFLRDWRPKNAASRHVVVIPSRKNVSRIQDVAQMLDVDEPVATALCENRDTFDLAPDFDSFCRMQSEVIAWPQSREWRFRAGDIYRRRMGG